MEKILAELEHISTVTEFQDWMLGMGKAVSGMDPALRTLKCHVRGCQSWIWLDTKVVDNQVKLRYYSETLFGKAICHILATAVNGKTPAQVELLTIAKFRPIVDNLSIIHKQGFQASLNLIKKQLTTP